MRNNNRKSVVTRLKRIEEALNKHYSRANKSLYESDDEDTFDYDSLREKYVFKDFEDFDRHHEKGLNGISEEWLKKHYKDNFREWYNNQEIIGSDCFDCEDCNNCYGCIFCDGCHDCIDCGSCDYCEDCIDCSNCERCTSCLHCEYCENCLTLSYGHNLRNESDEWNDEDQEEYDGFWDDIAKGNY